MHASELMSISSAMLPPCLPSHLAVKICIKLNKCSKSKLAMTLSSALMSISSAMLPPSLPSHLTVKMCIKIHRIPVQQIKVGLYALFSADEHLIGHVAALLALPPGGKNVN
jgi:hypothetical protein